MNLEKARQLRKAWEKTEAYRQIVRELLIRALRYTKATVVRDDDPVPPVFNPVDSLGKTYDVPRRAGEPDAEYVERILDTIWCRVLS